MNRIELVALFTALRTLHKEKNLDGIGEVIDAVLREASTEEKKGKKEKEEK